MVLNGRPSGISEESRNRIWEYARQVGYRPKGMSFQQSLPQGVGFVLRAGVHLPTQSVFFSHVQHGMAESLAEQGIPFYLLGNEDTLQKTPLKNLFSRQPAGLGVAVLGEVREEFLRELLTLEKRVVLVSAQYPGLCHSVISHEIQAGQLLAKHLIELGHRRFAWLGGNQSLQRGKDRFQAFQQALQASGVELDPRFIFRGEGADRMDGRLAVESLLKSAGKSQIPTAWVAYNSLMARGALHCLFQKGYEIPGQISLAAFDRSRVLTEETPSITGASADPERMGRAAVEILLKESKDEEVFATLVIPAELQVGDSTGVAP